MRFYTALILFMIVGNETGLKAAPLSKDVRSQVDDRLAFYQAEYGLVGYSAALLKNGDIVYTTCGGRASIELEVPVKQDTVFFLFSLAKLLVNVTTMQMVEADKISIDDKVGDLLDGLPPAWHAVTVRDLLSHTSGLPEFYQWPKPTPPTPEAAIESVKEMPFVFETGHDTRYNQTNFLLLKRILEKVSGQPFVELMKAKMLNPASAQHLVYGGEYAVVPGRAACYRPDGKGAVIRNGPLQQPDYFFASSGLNGNVFGLAQWFKSLLEGEFLSAETLATMWRPVELKDGQKSRFALGWEASVHKNWKVTGHGGGNLVDLRHYYRENNPNTVTVIFLTNGGTKPFWPQKISNDLADIVMGF